MPRALVIGGTGSIGRAVAVRLLEAGWHVDLTGRRRHALPARIEGLGGTFDVVDRDDDRALSVALCRRGVFVRDQSLTVFPRR